MMPTLLLVLVLLSSAQATIMLGRNGTTTTTTTTTTTVPTTTLATTTTAATTTSPTTTTPATTTTSTTILDGGALYVAGDPNIISADRFVGGEPTGTSGGGGAAQTDNHRWWITARAYTQVSGVARVHAAPGSGKSWAVKLYYKESALASTSSCVDAVGSTVNTTLCTISNTDRSCTFNIDLTTVNGNVGIAARSCFQVGFIQSGTPTNANGATVSLYALESSGDGITALASAATTSTNNTDWMGWLSGGVEANPTAVNQLWSAPKAVSKCTGALAVVTAPGGSTSWDYEVAVSTGAKSGTTQDCTELSYTTVAGCSITGADKNCSFALTSASVPLDGCIAVRRAIGTPTPAASGGENWSVECTTDASETAVTGGPALWGGFNTNLAASSFFAGPYLATASTVDDQNYWMTGVDALSTCSGHIGAGTTGSGSGSYAITLRYTTNSLAAGETCSQASGLAFSETATLCTLNHNGTDKMCKFTDAAVSIPAYACVQLHGVFSGTSTGVKSNVEWTLHCTK